MLPLLLLVARFGLLDLAHAGCIAGPIAMPIANISVSSYGSNRGVQLGVGTPTQYFALDASFEYNNTFIWPATSGCLNGIEYADCVAARGGVLQLTNSSTYKPMVDVAAAGGSLDDNAMAMLPNFSTWASDSFRLDSQTTIEAMPIGMLQPPAYELATISNGGVQMVPDSNNNDPSPAGFQGVIGLGSNSSLLNELTASGQLGSRVWSYFYGLTGATPDEQTNGTLVLGGYDAARVQGPNATFILDVDSVDYQGDDEHLGTLCQPNQPYLTVTNITFTRTLNGGQSNTTGLFQATQQPIKACIDLNFEGTMLMPEPLWTNFVAITGMKEYNTTTYGETTWIENFSGFNGTMNFTLGDGFNIHLDNNVLVQPTQYFDGNGDLTFNTSRPKSFIAQQPYYQPIGLLGRNFFSNAYIMFNSGKREMTVWQANATSREQRLVPVDDSGQVTQSCSQSSGIAAEGGAGEAATGGGEANHKLSGGAIAGAVIGSLAGAALIAVLVLFMWRRRHHTQVRDRRSVSLTSQRVFSAMAEIGGKSKASELTDKARPPELAGQPRAELWNEPSSELSSGPSSEPLSEAELSAESPQELPASYNWVKEMGTK